MINQDMTNGMRIHMSQKDKEIRDGFKEFTIEQWEEYLVYLIFEDQDPEHKEGNFDIDQGLDYLYLWKAEPYTTHFETTMAELRGDITPEEKKILSQAVENLISKYFHRESIFVEKLINAFVTFFDPTYGPIIGSFTSLSLWTVSCRKESFSVSVRLQCIAMYKYLVGNEEPSRNHLMNTLNNHRRMYSDHDGLLHAVIDVMIHKGFLYEALETITELNSEWPTDQDFENKLSALIGKEYIRDNEGLSISEIMDTLVPKMNESIRKKFLEFLKKRSCFSDDYCSAVEISKNKFPATEVELSNLFALVRYN